MAPDVEGDEQVARKQRRVPRFDAAGVTDRACEQRQEDAKPLVVEVERASRSFRGIACTACQRIAIDCFPFSSRRRNQPRSVLHLMGA
jgi:hypothetical protein